MLPAAVPTDLLQVETLQKTKKNLMYVLFVENVTEQNMSAIEVRPHLQLPFCEALQALEELDTRTTAK